MLGKTGAVTITESKVAQLDELLRDFCINSNTTWAIFATLSGQLVVQHGFVYSFDVLTIVALACGVVVERAVCTAVLSVCEVECVVCGVVSCVGCVCRRY